MSLDDILKTSGSVSPAREEHWIPLSDLMTGLMMLFMLIAIVFMVKVEADAKKVKDIAVIYDEMREQLYLDLSREFENDLPAWGAELDHDLTMRFKEPDVLFDTGQATLKPRFIEILNSFFPRYVRILSSDKYRGSIQEIRIEGHTSTIWNSATPTDQAYFLNMALSQSRTRVVLEHVLMLPEVSGDRSWLQGHMTANGLSSSRLIVSSDGSENQSASQRVEFRVRTNADQRIEDILKTVQQ